MVRARRALDAEPGLLLVTEFLVPGCLKFPKCPKTSALLVELALTRALLSSVTILLSSRELAVDSLFGFLSSPESWFWPEPLEDDVELRAASESLLPWTFRRVFEEVLGGLSLDTFWSSFWRALPELELSGITGSAELLLLFLRP